VERKFDVAVPVQEAMRKLWPQTAFTTTDVTSAVMRRAAARMHTLTYSPRTVRVLDHMRGEGGVYARGVYD
jgi:hypothetical protein